MRTKKHGYIIISGSGKKVGKTFLGEALLRHFSALSPIIALKISPHRHDHIGDAHLIVDQTDFRLFRENVAHHKNSGRLLQAGATASYFLETDDGAIDRAFSEFNEICNPDQLPVICESGALGKIIQPDIFYFIEDSEVPFNDYKESLKRLADVILPARIFSTKEEITKVGFYHNCFNLDIPKRFNLPAVK